MTERAQPTLLELLAPGGLAAANPSTSEESRRSSFVAASAAPWTETSGSAPFVSKTRANTNDALSKEDYTSFSKSGNALTASHHLFTFGAGANTLVPHQDGDDGVADDASESDASLMEATATARTSFSIVAHRSSVMYVPPATDGSSGNGNADDPIQTISFDGASNAAVLAAAAAASAFAPISGVASILSPTVATSPMKKRRSGPRATLLAPPRMSEREVDGERRERGDAASPPAPAALPRQRRSTLVGAAQRLTQSPDVTSPKSDYDQEKSNLAPQEEEGEAALNASYTQGIWASGVGFPTQPLNTMADFFSSLPSSGCPTPTSQGKPASLKLCSTTQAPIAGACDSLASPTRRSGGLMPRPSQSSLVLSDDGLRRRSYVTFASDEVAIEPAAAGVAAAVVAVDAAGLPTPNSLNGLEVEDHRLGGSAGALPLDGAKLSVICAGDDAAGLAQTLVGVPSGADSSREWQLGDSLPGAGSGTLVAEQSGDLSAASAASVNASTSTQRHRTSLPVLCANDLLAPAHPAAAAPPLNVQEGGKSGEDFRTTAAGADGGVPAAMTATAPSPEKGGTKRGSSSANSCTVTMAAAEERSSAPLPGFLIGDGTASGSFGMLYAHRIVSSLESSTSASASNSIKVVGTPRKQQPSILRRGQRVLSYALHPLTSASVSSWAAMQRLGQRVRSWLAAVSLTLRRPFASLRLAGATDKETSGGAAVTKKSRRGAPPLSRDVRATSAGSASLPSPVSHDKLFGAPLTMQRTGTFGDAPIALGSFPTSESLSLSLPLSRSPSPEAGVLEASQQQQQQQRASVVGAAEGLQQSLRSTWSGTTNAWFAAGSQPEQRTALRASGRIRQPPRSAESGPATPQLLRPSTPSRVVAAGGEDSSFVHSQRLSSPRSPHLSFAASFAAAYEGVSSSDIFSRSTLLRIPRSVAAAGSAGGSTGPANVSGDRRLSSSPWLPQQSSTAKDDSAVTSAGGAILDDAYRAQLYAAFRRPPSCCIGDISGCLATYAAMVETASTGQHVLNWKELSLLLLPEDYIDYSELFPPYHFITFPDFVEFVEVLSVRHRH